MSLHFIERCFLHITYGNREKYRIKNLQTKVDASDENYGCKLIFNVYFMLVRVESCRYVSVCVFVCHAILKVGDNL